MDGTKNATIIDVAKRAGVSVATVSRVVNGNYPVRQETRARVKEAITALKYVPNVQARELNTQHTSMIGVVVPSLYNMFFAKVFDGIEERARLDNYSLLLCCAKNDPQQEIDSIRSLVSRNVTGIIDVSPNTVNLREGFYRTISQRCPLVFVNGYHQVDGVSYVSNDEAKGTLDALNYLEKLGHKKILFVRGKNSDSYTVKEEAYRNYMAAHHQLVPDYIVNVGEGNSADTVRDTIARLMTVVAEEQPTAILCCNDLMAIGATRACKQLGLKVPDDISVIGFDNTALSQIVDPPITTMDQNMNQLGSSAAELLINKIRGGANRRITLANKLVVRESTGPVRAS